MYLVNGSGKQNIGLRVKSVCYTEGIETIIVLLPNSALPNGTEVCVKNHTLTTT